VAISPARDVAFQVLMRVESGGYASDLLRRESEGLDKRDAALAEAIVLGVLRTRMQLDFLIEHYGRRDSGNTGEAGSAPVRPRLKLDPEVRIALRMGIYQLRYLDRIPAHAAVTESVELVKRARKRSAAPLVNAILRKVDRSDVTWPDRATALSIPEWMLARWDARYGVEIAEGIARAGLEEPQAYLNPVTGRQQDIGAQSIVPLLDIEAGMTVLDLCAAPGNKTAQALAAGGRLVAADRYESRMGAVPLEAARVVLDATQPLPFDASVKFDRGTFDRILIDAPCSGTGTLAHNPEIKWRLKLQDLEDFRVRQRAMIERALPHLKPGGRMVYSTCSLEIEENEEAVSGFRLVETRIRIPGKEPGDGFFAAVIAG
jgi:16S rRNA (cytosine967-C5)-methyltransferase